MKEFADLVIAYFTAKGYPEWLINQVTFYSLLAIFCVTLINLIYKFFIKLFKYRNRRILNRDLHPYYTKKDIYNYKSV